MNDRIINDNSTFNQDCMEHISVGICLDNPTINDFNNDFLSGQNSLHNFLNNIFIQKDNKKKVNYNSFENKECVVTNPLSLANSTKPMTQVNDNKKSEPNLKNTNEAIYKKTTDRMMKRDSIYKKIKSKFFRFIHQELKLLICRGKRLSKLPYKIINDVTLVTNKILFQKTLQQIYFDECGTFREDKDIFLFTNNVNDYNNLREFLSKKLNELYIVYLNNEAYENDKDEIIKFEKDLKKIHDDDLIRYITKYEKYAKTMLDYFKP